MILSCLLDDLCGLSEWNERAREKRLHLTKTERRREQQKAGKIEGNEISLLCTLTGV